MSGTSHDGVDAALVELGGLSAGGLSRAKVKLLHFASYPYPGKIRKEIASASACCTPDICRLNFSLGAFFAKAANACISASGIRPDAIASHGQTVFHIPPGPPLPGGKKRPGSTLQIGEPSLIAQLTGVAVVAGFRPADMAVGGQGAPLVPFADHVLFRDKKGKKVRAVQNIGGIANVTVVTPSIDDVIAFDTGPGNCLIDLAMELFFSRPMDKGGKTASEGKPDKALLKKLGNLSLNYLKMPPPKSTGREFFSGYFLERALKGANPGISPGDVISTLTHFTAMTISDAYRRHILGRYPVEEIILCGGGTKNAFLVGLIENYLSPIKISRIDEYDIPSSAKEAMSFAILANETLCGRPSNVPGATGAARKVILGGIYLP